MKKLFSVILLGAAVVLASCNKDKQCIAGNGSYTTETRTVPEFTSVDANGSYEIYITQDSVQSVKVEAESNLQPRIRTEVSGNKLKIYTSGCITRNKTIKVYLSAKKITGIYLNGSGNIHGTNRFTTDDFSAEINGSGSIDAEIATPTADISVNGSGDIVLSGTADNCNAEIDGSGDIKAYDLQTKKTDADISGSGDIEISVSEELTVHISGSGNVYYKGTPAVKSVNISGSGKVEQR